MRRKLEMPNNMSSMTSEDMEEWIARVVAPVVSAPVNGELLDVEERVQAYERLHERSSADMLSAVRSGDLVETSIVCDWIFAFERRERLRAFKASQSA